MPQTSQKKRGTKHFFEGTGEMAAKRERGSFVS
jgi:hypothetical protein